MNGNVYIQHLKEKRSEYGITQKKLAMAVGISRQYLNKIENSKVVPTEEMKHTIIRELEKFNPNGLLDMVFDYVRIRFSTLDIKHVIEDVLRLKMDLMIHENYGFYSYSQHYRIGDIFVLVSDEENKGVLLELKGRGCRQFENYLLVQKRSWYDFFNVVLKEDATIKRLDLAINDKIGVLDIAVLVQKCINGEFNSIFHGFQHCVSGKLNTHRDEKECMGNTLYIGSSYSEFYICAYEKDYEQFTKNHIPIENADVKNRFELRLKNERAHKVIHDLITYDNPELTVFKIINRYICFLDKEEGKERNDWNTNRDWAWFVGENREPIRLVTKPETYTFNRTLNWISHQVAPTVKMLMKIDKINGTHIVDDIINNAKLKEKQEKLLKQAQTTTEEIIKDYK